MVYVIRKSKGVSNMHCFQKKVMNKRPINSLLETLPKDQLKQILLTKLLHYLKRCFKPIEKYLTSFLPFFCLDYQK